LHSLQPLLSTSDAAFRAKARSLSVGGLSGCESAPVTSLSSILAKAPSPRDRLQPPAPAPIRTRASTVPAGPIADRPARVHALYWLTQHCHNALSTAGRKPDSGK